MAGSGLPSSAAYSKTELHVELGLSASVQCEFDDNSSGYEQNADILFYFVQKANLNKTFLSSITVLFLHCSLWIRAVILK